MMKQTLLYMWRSGQNMFATVYVNQEMKNKVQQLRLTDFYAFVSQENQTMLVRINSSSLLFYFPFVGQSEKKADLITLSVENCSQWKLLTQPRLFSGVLRNSGKGDSTENRSRREWCIFRGWKCRQRKWRHLTPEMHWALTTHALLIWEVRQPP